MKITIVAPNGGWDLAFGGGTTVALYMAMALASEKTEVYLIALQALPKSELEKIHDVHLGEMVKVRSLYVVKDKLIRIPYAMGFATVCRFFKDELRKIKPDIVIFNDDAQKDVLNAAREGGSRTVLYMHYPLKVISAFLGSSLRGYEGPWLTGMLPKNRFLRAVKHAYARQQFASLDEFDLVFSNSSVTKDLCKHVWENITINVLNPPIRTPALSDDAVEQKQTTPSPCILLHSASQDGTFLVPLVRDVLKIISQKFSGTWRFYFLRCSNSLPRKLQDFRNDNIRLHGHVSRTFYRNLNLGAHVITHFKTYEGFGIGIAESMNEGAIPIVYQSDLNATWTDITDRGRFGMGFRSSKDFWECLEKIGDEGFRLKMAGIARKRAAEFGFAIFKEKVNKAVIGD